MCVKAGLRAFIIERSVTDEDERQVALGRHGAGRVHNRWSVLESRKFLFLPAVKVRA